MEGIPIKTLLTYAQEHSYDSYTNIYPPLLNLVVSQFPGLLTVVNLLHEEEQRHRYHLTGRLIINLPADTLLSSPLGQ